jgi:NAD(P)-dependent dehydrogenase (short-subunit alcohol dehydrogenase family)
MARRFEDKVALVTGAASGIGLATARAFAAEGAKLVIAHIDEEGAMRAAAAIEADGGKATGFGVDVADYDGCVAMVDHAMSRFGALHVAFNNAGFPSVAAPEFEEFKVEDWRRTIDVNLNGVFYCMKAEVPALRRSGGTAIVNTASSASFMVGPNIPAYITSKHGVAGLTKAAANDLIRHGIRVNAVCPGSTETGMTARRLADPRAKEWMVNLSPIGRFAKADEMARAVLFMASDEASYMVGSLMRVDGGMTLR